MTKRSRAGSGSDSQAAPDDQSFDSTTVELDRRWPSLVPVAAIVLIISVALIGSLTTDSDETSSTTTPTTRSESTSTTTTTTRPTPTTRLRTTTTLATSLDVGSIDLDGAVFALSQTRAVVRIDLVTGDVDRQEVDQPWGLEIVGDRLMLSSNAGLDVFDLDLNHIATLEGNLLAARAGEIWTETQGPQRELRRHDGQGTVELELPMSLEFVSGRFVDGVLHLATTNAQWVVDAEGGVTPVGPTAASADPFRMFSDVVRRCEPNQLVCRSVVVRDGVEIVIADDPFAPWRALLSPSGRFLLTEGMDGPQLLDLDGELNDAEIHGGDTWAHDADLIIRMDGRQLSVIDPVNGHVGSIELPRDILVREVPPRVVTVLSGS